MMSLQRCGVLKTIHHAAGDTVPLADSLHKENPDRNMKDVENSDREVSQERSDSDYSLDDFQSSPIPNQEGEDNDEEENVGVEEQVDFDCTG